MHSSNLTVGQKHFFLYTRATTIFILVKGCFYETNKKVESARIWGLRAILKASADRMLCTPGLKLI